MALSLYRDRPDAWSTRVLQLSLIEPRLRARLARQLATVGVALDGVQPWDPQVHDARFFRRLFLDGTLGAGESYVDGDWDCARLDELIARIARAGLERHVGGWWTTALASTLARFGDRHGPTRSRADSVAHYDRGDAFYRAMLGPSMIYSCGYWREANTLEEAQRAKMDLVCRKLDLRTGQRVLDVGCGWGGFARFAAINYGVHVVGVTTSPAQAKYATALCAGLPVDIHLADYREVSGRFDHIVSIGMFEHVGARNYRTYFDSIRRCLAEDGLFLLHTIGGLESRQAIDPWMDTYIFPDAVLPSARQITEAIEGRFLIEDWHNFGADYDRTLMAWYANVEAAWSSLDPSPDRRFRRLWRYYLLTCAGAFRARSNQLWQLVLSRHGVRGGYRRPYL